MFPTRSKVNIFNLTTPFQLNMLGSVEKSNYFKRQAGNHSVFQKVMCNINVVAPYKVLQLCNLKGLITTKTTHLEIQTRVFRIYHYAVNYCSERKVKTS
jgi:hypothetical protein